MKTLLIFCTLGLVSVLSGAAWSAEQPRLNKSQAVLKQLEVVQARITQVESESGPYAPGLLEPLRALSEIYLSAEDFEAIADIQSRQLQIMRAELGLDHPDNIAMVNDIIANNIRLNEWSKVNDNLEHIRYLESANGQGDFEPLLKAIEAQASWSIAQVAIAEPQRRARSLLDARDSYDEIKDLAQDAFGEDSVAMVPWLHKRAVNLYQVVAVLNGGNTLAGDALERVIQMDGVARLESSNSRALLDLYYSSSGLPRGSFLDRNPRIPVLDKDSLIGEAYLRDALSELKTITEIYEESGDIEAQAVANIHYADFRVLLGMGSGRKIYREAMDLLREAGIAENRISQFFDAPQIIPVENFASTFAEAEAAKNATLVPSISDQNLLITGFTALHEDAGNLSMPASVSNRWGLRLPEDVVEMTVNVSSTGVLSSAKFLAASSDEKGIRRTALRSVRGLRFRPRFEDRKAARVREMKLSYRFEKAP